MKTPQVLELFSLSNLIQLKQLRAELAYCSKFPNMLKAQKLLSNSF